MRWLSGLSGLSRTRAKANRQEEELNGAPSGKGEASWDRRSLAVYSTYCGSSANKTFNPALVTDGHPHFFISNNRDVLSEAHALGWQPIYLDVEVSEDPVVSAGQAKLAKALPHRFAELEGFDFTFYKDDKITHSGAVLEACVAKMCAQNACLAIRPHPFLSGNTLFEFGEAMMQPRYKAQWDKSVAYITQEIKDGYSLESTMYWTSAILRNMRHRDTRPLCETWYEHIDRCGIECQISFNFVAQRFSTISLLPMDMDNPQCTASAAQMPLRDSAISGRNP